MSADQLQVLPGDPIPRPGNSGGGGLRAMTADDKGGPCAHLAQRTNPTSTETPREKCNGLSRPTAMTRLATKKADPTQNIETTTDQFSRSNERIGDICLDTLVASQYCRSQLQNLLTMTGKWAWE
jgi:hypothetical protein